VLANSAKQGKAFKMNCSRFLLLTAFCPVFFLSSGIAEPQKKPFLPNRVDIKLEKAKLAAGVPVTLNFDFTLPAKHHLNLAAPSRMTLTDTQGEAPVTNPIKALKHAVILPALQKTGELEFSTMLYYCEDGDATLCLIRGLAITLPYETDAQTGVVAMAIPIVVP